MEIDRLSVALRSTNWQLSPKLEKNVYEFCDCIDIELHWSKNRFSSNPEAIFIQRTQIPSMEKVENLGNFKFHIPLKRLIMVNSQFSLYFFIAFYQSAKGLAVCFPLISNEETE